MRAVQVTEMLLRVLSQTSDDEVISNLKNH